MGVKCRKVGCKGFSFTPNFYTPELASKLHNRNPGKDSGPSIAWSDRANQWAAKIGYKVNTVGDRARDFQWLGKTKGEAMSQALHLHRQWAREAAEQKARGTKLPVWRSSPERLDAMIASGIVIDEPLTQDEATDHGPTAAELHQTPDPEIETLARRHVETIIGRQVVTLTAAKDRWLAAQADRIGKAGKTGLKSSTYNAYVTAIDIALKGKDGVAPIDAGRDITSITRADLTAYVGYWMGLAGSGEISECTAANYAKMFKILLDWCEDQDGFNFVMPKKADELFAGVYSSISATKWPNETKERLKALFADATARTKLYMLLALNCGFYQVDIAGLLRGEVTLSADEPCIDRRRKREKSTNHQTAPNRGLWWLFPETAELLRAELAPEGSVYALLNENGGPLRSESSDKAKTDAVSLAYKRLRDGTGKAFQFKQFRKLTSTFIVNETNNDNTGRLFLGQAPTGSLTLTDSFRHIPESVSQLATDSFCDTLQTVSKCHFVTLYEGSSCRHH